MKWACYECMHESMNGWMNGWMDGWISVYTFIQSRTQIYTCRGGLSPNVIIKIIEGQNIGTTINGSGKKLESKKRWLSTGIYESKGMLIVDEGAKKAILEKGASLLPAGILNIEGDFNRGDIISIKSKLVSTFAWGISNYSSNDIKLIKGKDSKNITELINKKYEPEIIHRDNLVISRESWNLLKWVQN